MHIYFSGLAGHGIGPLALIAKQAGYQVSGSDRQETADTKILAKEGIRLHIGQTAEAIAAVHRELPIDWLVYSSAVPRENPNHPELRFAKENDIKHTRLRDLLNLILKDHNLQLVALAGTHGKTTTTAMVVWLCKELGVPTSYLIGAPVPFGPMGNFDARSKYFIYECDEFDRNFLAFHPWISGITGLAWDHHEIYPTWNNYLDAFRDFISQSEHTIVWQTDADILGLQTSDTCTVIDKQESQIDDIKLTGRFNREDAWLAMQIASQLSDVPRERMIEIMNRFPSPQQRMEQLAPNLYTNYAHTPEKIRGGMSAALELAARDNQDVVILYEPLTNRRQHHIKEQYKDSFAGAKKIYWVPSYLAREDPGLPVLTPAELIPYLDNAAIAEPAILDDRLLAAIQKHLHDGDLVVAMGAAGGGSLDEWLRTHFTKQP